MTICGLCRIQSPQQLKAEQHGGPVVKSRTLQITTPSIAAHSLCSLPGIIIFPTIPDVEFMNTICRGLAVGGCSAPDGRALRELGLQGHERSCGVLQHRRVRHAGGAGVLRTPTPGGLLHGSFQAQAPSREAASSFREGVSQVRKRVLQFAAQNLEK